MGVLPDLCLYPYVKMQKAVCFGKAYSFSKCVRITSTFY